MQTDKNIIEHLMQLGKIELNEQQMQTVGKDVQDILGYVGILSEVDTSQCKACRTKAVGISQLREDTVMPSADSERLLDCTEHRSCRYYTVPKTVE